MQWAGQAVAQRKACNTLNAIILISIESMNTSIDKRIADGGTLFRKA